MIHELLSRYRKRTYLLGFILIFLPVSVVVYGLTAPSLKSVYPGTPQPKARTFVLAPDFENGMIYRGRSDHIRGAVNPTLRVYEGDTVTIRLKNTHGFSHDLVIPAFNLNTSALGPGETRTLKFRATTPGTYHYYCSVADHRANRMEGKLIVRPR